MTQEPRKPFNPGDILAGLSVALVAIPQTLAYAELAGMPAYTGLYAVALPALAASFFVSSPYLQTGPVATTSLLTFGILSSLAATRSPEYIALAALLALVVGLVRVLIGLLKWGTVAYLLSQPVLMGFMSAAAILIFSSQLPTALGVTPPHAGVLFGALWTLLHPGNWHPAAALLSLITVLLIRGGRRLHHLFPGVLIAVALGILYSLEFHYRGAIIGSIPAGLPALSLELPWRAIPNLVIGGVTIALVGFSEASSIARTFATLDRLRWNPNREFISQGVANLASGLSGGFPVGASFARSAINRLAGAQTRWAGAVTGLAILAFLPFVTILSPLPKAILAAIVISAIASLMRLPQLFELRRYSRSQAYIAWLTFAMTLGFSPRIDVAVILGIALAIAQHLRRERQLVLEHQLEGHVLYFQPRGVLWFGSASRMQERFTTLLANNPEIHAVKLKLGGLGRIDLSAAIMLRNLITDVRRAGLEIELLEVPPMARAWSARLWREALDVPLGSHPLDD